MKKIFLGSAILSALLVSCGAGNKLSNLSGEWNIISVDNQIVKSNNDAFIGFNIKEGQMYGNAGCNNMMASMNVDAKKSAISFSEVGSTRKMCRDMKLENKILSSLKKVAAYKVTNNGIALTDSKGNVVFTLSKKPAYTSLLDGEWIISVAGGKAIKNVEKKPFIVVKTDDMTVHGNGGCNLFNGNFTFNESDSKEFKFVHLNRTMKAGPGLEQEDIIMSAFENTRCIEFKNDNIAVLKDSEGKAVVVLKRNSGASLAK